MRIFLPCLLVLWGLDPLAAGELDAQREKPALKAEERKVFGIAERELLENCFYLEYPLSYQVDRKGGILPASMLPHADEIKEGDLHSLILRDPSGGLEVRASSYGFIRDSYSERGIKSPREVIMIDYVRDSMAVTITERDGMEVFRIHHEKGMDVIYLRKDAEWGQCFQSLRFLLKDKEKYGDFGKEIEGMIGSFVPSFARK